MSMREPAAGVFMEGLMKEYSGVRALDDVSLGVSPGRFLVLLGPSGSGKSTLIRCLAGIERPTSGRIEIGGKLVADGRRQLAPEQRDLAMVFQDFGLWPHMTVEENVAFALRRRRMNRASASKPVREMLERVGLHVHSARYPHELSGGEQQRVALARALVAGPGLMLFDEPLSSLDANLRERLRIEIGTLVREQGATAVYITHDQSEAFALGDEIGILQDGKLVQHGPPEVIYTTPHNPFVARFTGVAGALSGHTADAGPAGPGLVTVTVPTTDPSTALELTATATAAIPGGSAVQVLLRPTAARICRAGSRPAVLRGTVRDGAFHGRGYDYVIEIGDGLQLTGVFDRRRFDRGSVVEVFVQATGTLVFPDDRPSPGPLVAADAVLPAARAVLPAARAVLPAAGVRHSAPRLTLPSSSASIGEVGPEQRS